MNDYSPILHRGRTAHQEYHTGQLSLDELQQLRPIVESELEAVLNNPPKKGWASDAIGLKNRLKRHWDEWFTFLTHPEVKPDNNDAERALRPVVIHRKVSGGARSDWGVLVKYYWTCDSQWFIQVLLLELVSVHCTLTKFL